MTILTRKFIKSFLLILYIKKEKTSCVKLDATSRKNGQIIFPSYVGAQKAKVLKRQKRQEILQRVK